MSGGRIIDLLILDYGGVYSFDYDLESFSTIMQNTFGRVPDSKQRKKIDIVSRRLATGRISSDHYVRDVARILKTPPPSTEAFEKHTLAVTLNPSPTMIELVALVKTSGISVALLSNMYMFEVIETTPWGRYDGFDLVVFSAEVQLTKRDPEIFRLVLDHFDVCPTRTLFVDDIADHVQTAQRLGIHTIHADKTEFSNAIALVDVIRHRLQL